MKLLKISTIVAFAATIAFPVWGQHDVIQLRPVETTNELRREKITPQSLQDIEDLNSLLSQAEALRASGRDREAAELYHQAESLEDFGDHPNKNILRLKMGDLYGNLAQHNRALNTYQDIIEDLKSDTSSDADRIRNSALLKMGQVYSSSGNILKSKDIYLYLLNNASGNDKIQIINSLLQFYSAGIMTAQETQAVLGKLPENDPSSGYLHAKLAFDSQRKGDHSVAADEYMKAIKASPSAIPPERLESLYALFASEGKAEQLGSLLEKEYERNPKDEYIVLLLAAFRHQEGKPEQALSLLENSSNAGPEVTAAYIKLALEAGNYEQAFEKAKVLLRQSPMSLSYQELYGDVLFRWGKRREAVEHWKAIADRFGASDNVYITISTILKKRGLTEEALEVLEKARASGSASLTVQFEYLNSLLENRKTEEAWNEYLRLNKKDSQLKPTLRYRFIGTIVRLGLSDEIAPELKTLSARKPRDEDSILAHATLEQIYIQEGKFSLAVDLYENLDSFTMSEEVALIELAQNLAQLGEHSQAIKAYELLPDNSRFREDAIFQKSRILDRLGETQQAIDTLQSLAWMPQSATREIRSGSPSGPLTASKAKATFLISELLVKQKQPEKAENYLHGLIESAWRFMPEDQALVDLLLGDVYSQLGSLQQAQQQYEKVTRGQSQDFYEKAQFRLAELAFWTGRFEEASEKYEEFLDGGFDQELTNDALERIAMYTKASPAGLESFSQGELFAWQHRYEDAIRMFRETAAQNVDSDLSHWALFRVAELMAEMGEKDEALREYDRLLNIVENETILGKIRNGIIALSDTGQQDILDETIITLPNTVFADLARYQRQKRSKETQ